MIAAMKAKDAVRVSVLRGLMASFTNELVAKGRKPDEELADDETLSVISRGVKQRKDSIEQFEKGGRKDLAEAEAAEMTILQSYLPAQMSAEEIENFVKSKLDEPSFAKATGGQGKNQFMGLIMKELKGRVDGTLVKVVVDKYLS